MRTLRIKLYKFSELSSEAKEKAINEVHQHLPKFANKSLAWKIDFITRHKYEFRQDGKVIISTP